MRRFILTSPLIYGSIDLVYSDSELIQVVDFTPTTAAMSIRKGILQRLAKFPLVNDISQVIEGTQASVISVDTIR